MEIPNNQERPGRIARVANNTDTVRRLFRRLNNEEEVPFQKASLAIRGFSSMLLQGFKCIAITIILLLLAYVVFKPFLLFLIGMQDTH